jgi:hypothetical protein
MVGQELTPFTECNETYGPSQEQTEERRVAMGFLIFADTASPGAPALLLFAHFLRRA